MLLTPELWITSNLILVRRITNLCHPYLNGSVLVHLLNAQLVNAQLREDLYVLLIYHLKNCIN